MFAIDQIFPNGIKLLLSIGLILVIIFRCGGISFLLRILLRTAGLHFRKGILGSTDDEIFYIQKFAFLNGVRVKNIQDAKVIAKGLSTGNISRDQLFFTSLFGSLGKKKQPFENKLILVIGILVIICTLLLLRSLPQAGYANYTYDKSSLEISRGDIIIPKGFFNDDEIVSKNDCIRIIKSHPDDAYRSACEYLVLDNKEKQETLINAIDSWNEPRKIALTSFFLIICFFACYFFGSINHDKLNEYLLKVKE